MKKNLLIFIVLMMCLGVFAQSPTDYTLQYNFPAQTWTEALPIGNSKMGAMVFGGVIKDEIQLNEETFWSGSPYNNNSTQSLAVLDTVRQLIFDQKTMAAQKIVDENFFTGQHGMKYLTLGSLFINTDHANYTDYYRNLNIENATATTRYKVGSVNFEKTAFASFTDSVIVIKLKADKAQALNFSLTYSSPLPFSISTNNNKLTVKSNGVDHEGIPAALRAECQISAKSNGNISYTDSSMVVNNASEAIIYIAAATNFVNYHDVSGNESDRTTKLLNKAMQLDYNKSLANHIEYYQQQFNRVKLTLPQGENSKLETPKRLVHFAEQKDPSLVALMFNYGRYLLISSSQPGGQPANLQGIWNNSVNAPWDSKYTININAEMNYWPAEVTALPETHQPLFNMLSDLSQTGAITAKTMYDCGGWVAHHNTDIWRVCGPIDGTPWGMYPNGGAWLAQHLWQHFLFTGDVDFLRKYYGVLKGAADFYLDFMTKMPGTDYMVVVPSVSPEHGPAGAPSNLTAGCTMDNQIAFDALSSALRATQILNGDESYCNSLKKMIDKLPPMKVGQYNQLQEWLQDADDPKDEHRHISHLYGLYPSNQISPYSNPALFQAARNTLIQRGDMATGWSLGWKINFWARMLDGNHTYNIICNMLKLLPGTQNGINYFDNGSSDFSEGRTYPNLFDAHPPFQIDGNFGFTAGIAEMLVQSHDGAVHLLPALPDVWTNGKVSGLRTYGGFEFSFEWENGQVVKIEVKSTLGGNCRIRVPNQVAFSNGKKLAVAQGENPNPFFAIPAVKTPLISEKANLKPLDLKPTLLYDFDTKAGKTYVLTLKK